MNNTTQEYITVKSNLTTKRGIYQVVLNYYDNTHKRKQVSRTLGIRAVPGNKGLAKQKQKEIERSFEDEINTPKETIECKGSTILFSEYMKQWLETTKSSIEPTTYASYKNKVEVIAEYFSNKALTLADIKKSDIKLFYQYLTTTREIKPQTVRRYHANIHKSLNEAVDLELIKVNPANGIKLDKSEQYIASYYNKDELDTLFTIAKGSIIELHILLATYYGLRREEVCGLKWSAIDFTNNTITISHTVTHCCLNGKYELVKKNRTKNKSSYRTMPLVNSIKPLLLAEKEKQEANKKLFGSAYQNKEGYILVDMEGKLILPDRVTKTFRKLLKENGDIINRVRFHDLRHSCASLLLAEGINMKEIQAYLGHSNWNTTANLYSHLESDTKQKSADTIAKALAIGA